MRVTLIHNPGAGAQGEHGREGLLALLREAGHTARYVSARDEDWKKALEESADVVAVAGGDGTVARVAKAMLGRGIPLAPLPAGTANNISRTLGLAGRHWEGLARAWPEARRMKLDIGIAEGPWGSRRFVEGVGAGLFACLLSDDDPERKAAQGRLPDERVAHALAMLRKRSVDCAPLELKGTLDGEEVYGRCLLAEVLNIPYVGPNLFLAPDSKPGDGCFDVVIVTEDERDRLVNYLATWQENRERLAVLPSRRGKHLRVEWTGFELHIDDELWPEEGHTPGGEGVIDLRIAGAVDFLAPDAKKPK
ncbi:MAG TPA: diacylglycerol kinase family protein [Burkholderiales bacterium]|nr:diacylglycerol kinase family protein [Burkholderiales bacterium]